VFDTDLVRNLCGEIVEETDPRKTEDLMGLLQSVIKDDQEDTRLRMLYLAKKYGSVMDDSTMAAD